MAEPRPGQRLVRQRLGLQTFTALGEQISSRRLLPLGPIRIGLAKELDQKIREFLRFPQRLTGLRGFVLRPQQAVAEPGTTGDD